MNKKPSFLKNWRFYLFGKSIKVPGRNQEIRAANQPLAGGIGGGLGSVVVIYAININELIFYILAAVFWLMLISLTLYLVLKPYVVDLNNDESSDK